MEDNIFEIYLPNTDKKYKAQLKFINENKYLLLKDSFIRNSFDNSFITKCKIQVKIKQEMIDKCYLVNNENDEKVLLLNVNYEFDNPSSPACLVMGSSRNGMIEWKTKDNRTIKEFLALKGSTNKIKYDKDTFEDKLYKQDEELEDRKSKLQVFPLNQILYGPPGTGKTYNTAIESLKIIMDKEDFQQLDLTDRTSVMEKYRYYKEKEQIKFITFHQSYSYEDFVEGIKPTMDSDEVKYEIKPGVLKLIANLAKSEYISPTNSQIDIDFNNRRIFRVYLNELYDECIEKNILKYEKLYETDEIFNQLEPDDLILVYSTSVIKAIGLIYSKNEDSYNVEWLIKDESIPCEKISKKTFRGRRVCQLSKESIDFEELKQLVKPSENKIKRNYVLIIDEINRGNISKIMGELITLLEEDKRLGQENEISSILPYSGEEFILPLNLYTIGTMNSTDKSIAMIDVALRRRFIFEEIMPNPELVKHEVEEAKVKEVFEELNHKICQILDRDHQIGHSYFMENKINTLADLKYTWFKSIIPLLSEYFYNDWNNLRKIIPTFIDETHFDSKGYYTFKRLSDYEKDPSNFVNDFNQLGSTTINSNE